MRREPRWDCRAAGPQIGLPDEGDARHGSAGEFSFHGSERYRLVTADHLGLLVAGRKGNKKGRDQTRRAFPPADRVAPGSDEAAASV